ncbi:MAG: urease accessory protein UreF [Rivularia sp. (in: Bacteria)]|nr:urease accessory protein UreF [Rivularia sp. MS3]
MPHASCPNLLYLLQLVSPALPVGAYSYSEGLETLVETKVVCNVESFKHWLIQELRYGAIRLEAAVMLRSYRAVKAKDFATVAYWNNWLSATRETEELRNQSLQMGSALIRLLKELQPQVKPIITVVGNPCNYAIAFGVAASIWEINSEAVILGYLHSWLSNLITAGVKLIPLGQTAGQLLLINLQELISTVAAEIINLDDDELSCCSWGLSLASMNHEQQYTRLFRS